MTTNPIDTKRVDLESLRGHTPAPWLSRDDWEGTEIEIYVPRLDGIGDFVIVEEVGGEIRKDENGEWSDYSEVQANARLIAAAPDLLAELTERRARDSSLEAREAKVAELVTVHKSVLEWAQSRCPCQNEKPDPCPLCGADVATGSCKAVESIFPCDLLADLRAALAAFKEPTL